MNLFGNWGSDDDSTALLASGRKLDGSGGVKNAVTCPWFYFCFLWLVFTHVILGGTMLLR